jgi:tetratricopeptide (TPR) repeat protein
LFSICALKAQDEKVNSLLKESDVLISSGKLSEALQKAREAVSISPQFHPAIQKEINILFLMKDEKESIRLADEAIDKYPDIAGYFYLRGIINNGRGKYSRALDDFTRAIELDQKDILYRCYLGRGLSYFNLLEYDAALTDLSQSIQQNDTVASAWYSRGMVNYELRDYPSAVQDFQKTLTYSEGNAALYFNLGMSYFRLNEKEKACPNFNKSCSMGNTSACRMTMMECVKAIPSVP